MKRLVLFAMALAFSGAALATAAGAPRISVDPRSFDFGRVRPGRDLWKEFRVANGGSAVLSIESVSTSCQCTTAPIADADRNVAPGKSISLRVRLVTPEEAGPVRQSVRIRSNDPERRDVEIEIRARVVRGAGGR